MVLSIKKNLIIVTFNFSSKLTLEKIKFSHKITVSIYNLAGFRYVTNQSTSEISYYLVSYIFIEFS